MTFIEKGTPKGSMIKEYQKDNTVKRTEWKRVRRVTNKTELIPLTKYSNTGNQSQQLHSLPLPKALYKKREHSSSAEPML